MVTGSCSMHDVIYMPQKYCRCPTFCPLCTTGFRGLLVSQDCNISRSLIGYSKHLKKLAIKVGSIACTHLENLKRFIKGNVNGRVSNDFFSCSTFFIKFCRSCKKLEEVNMVCYSHKCTSDLCNDCLCPGAHQVSSRILKCLTQRLKRAIHIWESFHTLQKL